MIGEIFTIIFAHPIISSLGGVATLLAGHWLITQRDRRKEFNEAADAMSGILNKYRGELNGLIPASNFDAFQRHLPWWKIRGFSAAVSRYYKAYEDCMGDRIDLRAKDMTTAHNAHDEIKTYTKRR